MKKTKKNKIITITLIVISLLALTSIYLLNNKEIEPKDYSGYYSEIAVTTKDSIIYKLVDNNYIEAGTIYKNTKILLEEPTDKTNEFFKLKDLDGVYYIKYNDIKKEDKYYEEDTRYKKYIAFNENIITNEQTTFYKDSNKLYTINHSIELPIIIKEEDKYYVEYNNMLLYVMKESVKEVRENNNTEEKNTNGIPILNYHFVYKPEEEKCNQEICHPEKQFREHLSYIKDNNFFTPTMEELEQYIDGKIRLPKSVVITIDDGRNVNIAIKIIEEYELNATAFIVTSRFDVENDFIKSDYVELQSHSHSLHDVGTCPPGHGQGGGLTCLSDEKILEDLKQSREVLNGAKAFCYPFYEYNSHSIELLKEAGFTMAFAGEYAGGQIKATVGIDKYRIPRWVIVTYTTMERFKSYVNGGR